MTKDEFRMSHVHGGIAAAGLMALAALAAPVEPRFNPNKRYRGYAGLEKQPHSRGPARQPKPRKGKSHNSRRSR